MTGKIISVVSVPEKSPPTTEIAVLLWIVFSADGFTAIGRRAKMVVQTVARMGFSLEMLPLIISGKLPFPKEAHRMIDVLIVVPRRIRIPKNELILILFPVIKSKSRLQKSDRGNDISSRRGTVNDSNCAPRIKYIRITAKIKTIPISLKLRSRAVCELVVLYSF